MFKFNFLFNSQMTMIYDLQQGEKHIRSMKHNASIKARDRIFPGIPYSQNREESNQRYIRHMIQNEQKKRNSSLGTDLGNSNNSKNMISADKN